MPSCFTGQQLKRNDGDEHVDQPTPAVRWLAVLSVMLFGCFAISLGPLFWLAISQIYPLGVVDSPWALPR